MSTTTYQPLTEELRAFLVAHEDGGTPTDAVAQHYPYSLPQNALQHDSLAALRNRVESSGSFFFSPGALRFFSSRILSGVIGRRFFLTSERHGPDAPRHYRVRWTYAYGEGHVSVETLGTLFTSADQARAAARELARLVTA